MEAGNTPQKNFFYFLYVQQHKSSFFPIFINKYLSNAKINMGDNLRARPSIFSWKKYHFIYIFILAFSIGNLSIKVSELLCSSPVTLYHIEVVFGGGVFFKIYTIIRLVPKKLNKVINGSLTHIIIIINIISSRPFYWILLKEANLFSTGFDVIQSVYCFDLILSLFRIGVK